MSILEGLEYSIFEDFLRFFWELLIFVRIFEYCLGFSILKNYFYLIKLF